MRGLRRAALASLLLAAPGLGIEARAASLQVEVDGVEPGGGPVRVALCQGGLSEAYCTRGEVAQGYGARARVAFPGVAPGTYAVAAFQDENGDGRLDRTGLGLPLEPYGFSGEVGRRARPDFARAAFGLTEPGALVRVRLARALQRR